MLIAKIHRATVTQADIDYVGSITIDAALLEASGILQGQRVQVVDVENGARLETYVIRGEHGRGEIQMNGAAARLVQVGDHVIIMAYGLVSDEELATLKARVLLLDEHNRVAETRLLEPMG
ncbi:MAG: aspartate 1-decarboxylase [Anaerolineaceae bacterium]|nr:aspartate 1-decarboxylase [Anaerolineaceae bacterium]